jgi:uncharacterized protein
MKYHDRFDWDPRKSEANRKKHGLAFQVVAQFLADEQADRFHYEEYDDKHSTAEDRYTTYASHPLDRSLVIRVTWTDRSKKGQKITRIISARGASAGERGIYEQVIKDR